MPPVSCARVLADCSSITPVTAEPSATKHATVSMPRMLSIVASDFNVFVCTAPSLEKAFYAGSR